MNEAWLLSLKDCLHRGEKVLLTGLSGSARAYMISELAREQKRKILCLVPNEERAYDLSRDLEAFQGKNRVFLFLARNLVFMKENLSYSDTQRLLTLQELLLFPRRAGIVIATSGALLHHIMAPSKMRKKMVELKTGCNIEMDGLLRQLVEGGYIRVSSVTRPGEMAARGGILDIYPIGGEQPCRVEFFGDQVDSIRRFNVDSQRSGDISSQALICPADEMGGSDAQSSLFDYLEPGAFIFLDEPRETKKVFARERAKYREFLEEARRQDKAPREVALLEPGEMTEQIEKHPMVYHSFFPSSIPQVQFGFMQHISQKEMESFHNQHENLFLRLKEWREKNYTVKIMMKNPSGAKEIKKALSDHRVTGVEFINAHLGKGFVSPTLELAIVSELDIWGKRGGKRQLRTRKNDSPLLIEELQKGDYVVHEHYGIGIYHGVTQEENGGFTREYVLLQYAGTDRLYLPVDKLDLLYKYNTSEEKPPRLSKLGGSDWERTRKKVSASIEEMAEELLALYATRENIKGYAFAPDTPWQRQFEDDFPFQETPDQLKAIRDAKRDMERPRPMDRLICGDVGYGKTEVAMRAAFKAIMDGKQAALLVPTTVLAEQHYQSFRERFSPYPTTVEVLSRFKTIGEQKRILDELRKGAIDIIIGTHRLLSSDVVFHDLGLLVIDEEHRFGVAQKEKIKKFREVVDVLSLSATPIPRSLYMSLTGLRDLSVIETPPPERYPISTYVLEFNEEIIREAVMAETERGGQVFFVHNRIQDIHLVEKKLKQLLPEVSIGVGHGRMKEQELARVMMDFIKGHYQLFLCTTIIESGLDMPNVNTIIIDEADKMGLAQLYQLRGRVGRSNRLAYAYLTYRPDKVITEAAQKRLNAIREFNELGAGMKIALRDLEIRGAGNILGAEQHGYIQKVGFDLYCRLLEQHSALLRGEKVSEEINPQLDIDADYYLPDSYISDSGAKIRIYRRLLLAREEGEIEEMRAEMLDRFGQLPRPVENFLQIAALRIQARKKAIKSLRRIGHKVEIQMTVSLPANFPRKINNTSLKKINDYTLEIPLGEGTSLQDLAGILNSI